MRRIAIVAAALAFLAAGFGAIGVARAEKVDLLLILAADVSRSIDDQEFSCSERVTPRP